MITSSLPIRMMVPTFPLETKALGPRVHSGASRRLSNSHIPLYHSAPGSEPGAVCVNNSVKHLAVSEIVRIFAAWLNKK